MNENKRKKNKTTARTIMQLSQKCFRLLHTKIYVPNMRRTREIEKCFHDCKD